VTWRCLALSRPYHRYDPSFSANLIMTYHSQWNPWAEGRKMVRALKQAEGGALNQVEMAERLGVTVDALQVWTAERQVVAWEDGAKTFRYPVWQLGNHGLMPGIRECLAELSSSDKWAIMRFFLTPSEQLGNRTPLALVRNGQIADAIELARSRGVDGQSIG